jgi:hypothetical protein
VRLLSALGIGASLLFATLPSRADEPDRAGALLAGGAALVVGFAAGALVVATGGGDHTRDNIGWITMQSGFAAAPFVAHAAVGEWARGLAFTAAPAAMLGGTEALFQYDPGTISHGSLPEQRVLWSLFGLTVFTGAIGVIDVTFPRRHAPVSIRPTLAAGRVGLEIGGAL